MSLPRGDEYNQAIQSPRISFSDATLQLCQVETTPLGLPKPYSGGFTTTYKLKNSSANWAVRCFTREINDLPIRYQSIGNFINSHTCPFLVEAKYLQSGIKVNGIFHPIIKMKWLEGEPLNVYLSKNYTQKNLVDRLAIEFVNLVKQLESFGIAHGDLQHGNIIVKNDKLFLIDYDGMFFPDLSNLSVNELGHPNFQHPKRSPIHYNKSIDRFSAIVIYTALKAISLNPNLWKKYDNGDNLLFKGHDFINPQNSQLLRDIASNPELSNLSANLAAVCYWDFNRIPTLQEFTTSLFTSFDTIPISITTVRSAYLVIDGTQKGRLLENIGNRVEVVGKISDKHSSFTRSGAPYLFLNFGSFPHQTFTIVLWSETLTALKHSGINPDNFTGKFVSVTGVITSYTSYGTTRPQIAIDFANQIQILSGQDEVNLKLGGRQANIPTNNSTLGQIPTKSLLDGDVLNELYKNRPVSAPKIIIPTKTTLLTPPPPRVVQKTSRISTPSYPSTSSTYRSVPSCNSKSTSPNKSNKLDSGCLIPIICAIVLGLIFGAFTEHGNGFFLGAIIGGVIGFVIQDRFF